VILDVFQARIGDLRPADVKFLQALEFTQFHVSPVCAPTRASLMTGRYNFRTGVADVFGQAANMDPNKNLVVRLTRRLIPVTERFHGQHFFVRAGSASGREPADDLTVIRRELELFRSELLERPQLVAATKIDALDDVERVERLRAKAAEWHLPVFTLSAVTGQGVPALLEALWRGVAGRVADDEFES